MENIADKVKVIISKIDGYYKIHMFAKVGTYVYRIPDCSIKSESCDKNKEKFDKFVSDLKNMFITRIGQAI